MLDLDILPYAVQLLEQGQFEDINRVIFVNINKIARVYMYHRKDLMVFETPKGCKWQSLVEFEESNYAFLNRDNFIFN